MKYIYLALVMLMVTACSKSVTTLPEGEFTYNVPCRVVNINTEKPGKAIVLLWLHGGVHDYKKHDFFSFNHLDCVDADERILEYLKDSK